MRIKHGRHFFGDGGGKSHSRLAKSRRYLAGGCSVRHGGPVAGGLTSSSCNSHRDYFFFLPWPDPTAGHHSRHDTARRCIFACPLALLAPVIMHRLRHPRDGAPATDARCSLVSAVLCSRNASWLCNCCCIAATGVPASDASVCKCSRRSNRRPPRICRPCPRRPRNGSDDVAPSPQRAERWRRLEATAGMTSAEVAATSQSARD
ncbi:hypothetical protein GGI43DRAFT_283809 [Trichoderma evansii]